MWRKIFFHEDDHRQIELVPIENLAWCNAETERIEQFSREHRAGIGWTDVYRLNAPPLPISNRSITRDDLRAALRSTLPAFDRVTTGYSTHVERARGVAAFGIESEIVIFAAFDRGIATAVWLHVEPSTAKTLAKAKAALDACQRWQLLLVDWAWCVVVPLDSNEDAAQYLRRRSEAVGYSAESNRNPGWFARVRRWLGAV